MERIHPYQRVSMISLRVLVSLEMTLRVLAQRDTRVSDYILNPPHERRVQQANLANNSSLPTNNTLF